MLWQIKYVMFYFFYQDVDPGANRGRNLPSTFHIQCSTMWKQLSITIICEVVFSRPQSVPFQAKVFFSETKIAALYFEDTEEPFWTVFFFFSFFSGKVWTTTFDLPVLKWLLSGTCTERGQNSLRLCVCASGYGGYECFPMWCHLKTGKV